LVSPITNSQYSLILALETCFPIVSRFAAIFYQNVSIITRFALIIRRRRSSINACDPEQLVNLSRTLAHDCKSLGLLQDGDRRLLPASGGRFGTGADPAAAAKGEIDRFPPFPASPSRPE
jgi:hypothetical protein